ncbi:hypothetical protein AcW1_003227 [Taiwanofungus camphoratus]|nr:hypothetical protein AcW1_003227 [Antrodia cinnamomea]
MTSIHVRTKKTAVTPEHARYLTEQLTYYWALMEKRSAQVRHLGPDLAPIYERETEKWSASSTYPNVEPQFGDAKAKAEFTTKVDTICSMEPRTTEECCLVIFACWAGVQRIINQEIRFIPDNQHEQIMTNARQALMEQRSESDPASAMRAFQPQALAYFPQYPSAVSEISGGATAQDGGDLIGHRIRGDFYVVEEEDANGGHVAREVDSIAMYKILANRIPV